jgi:hypothetical protein
MQLSPELAELDFDAAMPAVPLAWFLELEDEPAPDSRSCERSFPRGAAGTDRPAAPRESASEATAAARSTAASC